MRKQIDGQISLFDYIAAEEKGSGRRERSSQDKTAAQEEKTDPASSRIAAYAQCADCWCSDCKHNEKLDAVPRDFAGVKKACPSCAFCLEKKKAEICEIGSYDNGCKLRASEEGMGP